MDTPIKSRSDQKRDQILKVASELFMIHGFNAVTMDAIADAAPVSKPTLYNHFDSKAALFFAVMETRASHLFHTLKHEISHSRAPKENMTIIGQNFLDVILKPDAVRMYRIMLAESGNFPELGRIFYESGPRKICALIAEYLTKEHEFGHLHVPKPDLSANFFINMIKGNGHMQVLMGVKDKIPPKERAEIIEYAVDIFLNGHKAP